MQVAVLLYPGCIFFEIALAVETLARHLSVRYYTPDGSDHRASNGAVVMSAGDLPALESASIRALLIPGGDPRALLVPEPLATRALRAQAQAGTIIAGICAGNLVMASAGLLAGRRGTHNYTDEYAPPDRVAAVAPFWAGMQFQRANLVQDGNLITAQPWAYRPYAAALGRSLGVLTTHEAAALERYVQARMSVAQETPDQPEVISLIRELDDYQDTLYPPEARYALGLDSLKAPDVVFVVARDSAGRAVGCGAVVIGAGTGELKRMYVRPASRGQGVAQDIIAALEAAAARRGCRELKLETGPRQPEALSFYRQQGYRPCGPFGSYPEHPLSVFMEKTIAERDAAG